MNRRDRRDLVCACVVRSPELLVHRTDVCAHDLFPRAKASNFNICHVHVWRNFAARC